MTTKKENSGSSGKAELLEVVREKMAAESVTGRVIISKKLTDNELDNELNR